MLQALIESFSRERKSSLFRLQLRFRQLLQRFVTVFVITGFLVRLRLHECSCCHSHTLGSRSIRGYLASGDHVNDLPQLDQNIAQLIPRICEGHLVSWIHVVSHHPSLVHWENSWLNGPMKSSRLQTVCSELPHSSMMHSSVDHQLSKPVYPFRSSHSPVKPMTRDVTEGRHNCRATKQVLGFECSHPAICPTHIMKFKANMVQTCCVWKPCWSIQAEQHKSKHALLLCVDVSWKQVLFHGPDMFNSYRLRLLDRLLRLQHFLSRSIDPASHHRFDRFSQESYMVIQKEDRLQKGSPRGCSSPWLFQSCGCLEPWVHEPCVSFVAF